MEKPLARHRRVSHAKGRAAGPDRRGIHAGNPGARSSPPDRGRRTDRTNQAGARVQECALSREDTGVDQIAKADVEIRTLGPSPAIRAVLSELLIEAVANGGSVSFMDPLPPEMADKFWEDALSAAAAGERVVLGAVDSDVLLGAVTLGLHLSANQPHRAEIVKMITRISHRGRGVPTALLRRAESMALARGRTLLVLDTASDGGAATLYESVGFRLAGEIPDYAFKPQGGLSGTKIYWKRLATAAAA